MVFELFITDALKVHFHQHSHLHANSLLQPIDTARMTTNNDKLTHQTRDKHTKLSVVNFEVYMPDI
jgi:hypothetical protein